MAMTRLLGLALTVALVLGGGAVGACASTPAPEAQHAAIETMEQTANDPSLYLDMDFQPGDIQWLKNAVILHKRTSYEDWDNPEQKRHLLRLWLAAPDFEDGDAQLRRGITI